MSLTIFHNPRCSKSRETLKLIEERGLAPKIVRYLDDPPDAATLESLLTLLGIEPRDLMRKKEPEYRALGLDDPSLSREALVAAMAAHPRLIERPIVIKDGKAVLGRPPEQVLEIL
jgi:arsenate reductase